MEAYQPKGYCPGCGYQIDPGRCSECGLEVSGEQLRGFPPTRSTVLILICVGRLAAFSVVHFGFLMVCIFMALGDGLIPSKPPTGIVELGRTLADALMMPANVAARMLESCGRRQVWAGASGTLLMVGNSLAFVLLFEGVWQFFRWCIRRCRKRNTKHGCAGSCQKL